MSETAGIGTHANPTANPADVDSIDAILKALYESVSFHNGSEPEWQRMRTLFLPGAHMIPPRNDDSPREILTLDEWIDRSREGLSTDERFREIQQKGFQEKEIARRYHRFGSIAQVFSTYEARFYVNDLAPIGRGINSIQLLLEDGRWWVVSVLWDNERPDNPIPYDYL